MRVGPRARSLLCRPMLLAVRLFRPVMERCRSRLSLLSWWV